MDLLETKSLLRRYGISPNRFRGQNFLVDEKLAKKEVEFAEIEKRHRVLEIGPGLGALTEHLLKKGCRVIAIEKDRVLSKVLSDRFSSENIEIITADALKTELPDFDIVVSNIPYVISSPITFKLFECGFLRGVLTYQEEFARRLIAEPGDWDYSRLTVTSSYYADTKILKIIPQKAFFPQPRVKSAIVFISPRPPQFEVDKERFFKLVRGMFTVKRKTVKNAIQIAEKIEGVRVNIDEISEKLLEKRVFELSPEEIANLSKIEG
jgi:16S rRNA (adenine1518-N6/adenine1519-N6)-dimethyltransferase